MTRLLQRLVHELGNGRAVANAGRERREYARMLDAVDALRWRLLPAAGADGDADERVAA